MSHFDELTKIPIKLLKFLGYWSFTADAKWTRKVFQITFKLFNILLNLWRLFELIESIVNLKLDIEEFEFTFMYIFACFSIILLNLNPFNKEEWSLISKEIIEIEVDLCCLLEVPSIFFKVNNLRKFLQILPIMILLSKFIVLSYYFTEYTMAFAYIFVLMVTTIYMILVLFLVYCLSIQKFIKNTKLCIMKWNKLKKMTYEVHINHFHGILKNFQKLYLVNQKANKFFMLKLILIIGN